MPAKSKKEIKRYLLKNDARLRPLITAVSYPVFHHSSKDIYYALVQSVVSQQLSVKAAATIYERLLNLFPAKNASSKRVGGTSLARLRSAGLSKQKAGYIKSIAKVAETDGLNFEILSKKSDSELIDILTEIHGVGQWTVEMLLMFTFMRKDVFPVADVGIQNAMRRLYGLTEEGKEFKQKIISLSEQWRPYRTVVCRYLWAWKSTGYMK